MLNAGTQKLLKMPKWKPLLRALFTWQADQDDEDGEVQLVKVEAALAPEAAEHLRRLGITWLHIFKELEKRGAGKVTLGRHGRPTRFEWEEPPATFAQAALTFMDDGAVPASAGAEASAASAPLLVRYSFPLRSELMLEVRVPTDVTHEELARLADFTRLLPAKG